MPVRRIVEQASRLFGIPADQIVGPRRARPIVHARHAVCLAAFMAGRTSPHIGRVLNDRDHSTVLWAISSARNIASRDPEYAAKAESLIAFALGPIEAPFCEKPPQPARLCKLPPAGAAVQLAKPRTVRTCPIIPGVKMEIGESGELEPVFSIQYQQYDPLLTALKIAHPERFAA